MSLRLKFAALFALLGMTLVVNAAVSAWALRAVEAELTRPLEEAEPVLRALSALKRAVGTQHNLISTEPAPMGPEVEAEADAAAVSVRLGGSMVEAFDRLEALELHRMRSGISTTLNVRRRVEGAQRDVERWFSSGDEGARAEAQHELYEIHELIERVEERILDDVLLANRHAGEQRPLIHRILISSGVSVVIASVLGLGLVRRWVLTPVAALRVATERIAGGDFDHRIEARGNDELSRLSREVDHMAAMVRRYQDERIERERLAAIGEMLRRIVHNLRSPLSGMRGLAELTRASLPEGDERRDAQDRIIRTVDRADSWLRQLLNVTKPLEIHPSVVVVGEWLVGAVESRRPSAEAKGVRLEARWERGPAAALFDPTHLEHALAAIVDNAIEASPAGGVVRVTSTGGDRKWVLRVEDEGPGAPVEVREEMFKPYVTTKPTGTGIGLAMTSQIVHAHGGHVRYEEGSGTDAGRVGAVIVIELPNSGVAQVAETGQTGAHVGENPGH